MKLFQQSFNRAVVRKIRSGDLNLWADGFISLYSEGRRIYLSTKEILITDYLYFIRLKLLDEKWKINTRTQKIFIAYLAVPYNVFDAYEIEAQT